MSHHTIPPSPFARSRKGMGALLLTKALKPKAPKARESYFASCDRDEQGHCLPSGEVAQNQDIPLANRPTKPEERHKNSSPPKLKFQPPPPPKGKKGMNKAGGFSATGRTNTEVGDAVEELLSEMGFRPILPLAKDGKTVKRQNPLDVEWDHSGMAFEIKACTTAATEYKAKPKAKEVEEKKKYAEEHQLEGGIIIPVVDYDNGEVHVYWREGIGAFSLSASEKAGEKWHYAGTKKFRKE